MDYEKSINIVARSEKNIFNQLFLIIKKLFD